MICTKCGNTGEFYKGRRQCKKCILERSYDWQSKNPHRVAAARRKYNAKRKDKQNAYYKEWYRKNGRKRDPLKVAAHKIIYLAIRSGRISRPSSCEECGRDVKIEAHHDDYLKPLDVLWLCNRCHRKKHQGAY